MNQQTEIDSTVTRYDRRHKHEETRENESKHELKIFQSGFSV